MRRTLLYISILILSLILLFPELGLRAVYSVQKAHVRHEVRSDIKARASDAELVDFVVHVKDTLNGFRWKHSKEFSFQNTMYDVVHRNVHNDSVYYQCWMDTKETVLSQRYAAMFNQELSHNQPLNSSKTYVLKIREKLNSNDFLTLDEQEYLTEVKNNFNYKNDYSSQFGEQVVPPPQITSRVNS